MRDFAVFASVISARKFFMIRFKVSISLLLRFKTLLAFFSECRY